MILCIGEIISDLIGIKEDGITKYESYAGGAPFNVACDINKLNGDVGFIGRVGKDLIGDFLLDVAEKERFKLLQIQKDPDHNTTLALVRLSENGERRFSFLRKQCADYRLEIDKINPNAFLSAKIVHVGSLMLSEKEGRENFDKIITMIKKSGALFSFDVNYREDLFDHNQSAIEKISDALKEADIIKFSEDEIYRFINKYDLVSSLQSFKENQIVFVTLGEKGSVISYRGKIINCPSISVSPIDTTGAGDAFYAAALFCLDKCDNLSETEIYQMLKFSNICGALTTTRKGAINAFPSLEEIKYHYCKNLSKTND